VPDTASVKLPGGETIVFYKDNAHQAMLFNRGYYPASHSNFKFASALVPKPRIVLDIGANIGQTSIFYSKWADWVLAFEPGRYNTFLLKENMIANGCGNVVIHSCAVGAKNESVPFNELKMHGDISYVASGKGIQTASVAIDEMNLSSNVDFIKIDVEGFEPFVLEGVMETTIQNRPFFQVECIDSCLARYNCESKWILEWFAARDYVPVLRRGNSGKGKILGFDQHQSSGTIRKRKKAGQSVEGMRYRPSDIFFIPEEEIDGRVKDLVVGLA
jgi:FkbM family methyltransferase